jgi:hypothetical protein
MKCVILSLKNKKLMDFELDFCATEYAKSFKQLYILENCLQTGRWLTELFVVNFSVKACSAAFLENTSNDKNSNSPL